MTTNPSEYAPQTILKQLTKPIPHYLSLFILAGDTFYGLENTLDYLTHVRTPRFPGFEKVIEENDMLELEEETLIAWEEAMIVCRITLLRLVDNN